jgi:WD40 repeat protein
MRQEGAVYAAAFSPDGTRVLTVSEGGTARLWDAVTGRRLGASMRHDERLVLAALSPDGARVLTAAEDGTVRLWDAFTGARLGASMRHDLPVLSAVFSPDGSRILTAASDGTARLWDVGWPEGPITAVACALLPDRDVGELAERYGIVIRSSICGPDMPAPDLTRLDRQ